MATVTGLESELRTDTWTSRSNTTASYTATDATCVGQTVRSNGAGVYQCRVEFDNDTSSSFAVTVDDAGRHLSENNR